MKKNMVDLKDQEEFYANIILFLGEKINKKFRYEIKFNTELNCYDLSLFFNEIEESLKSLKILKEAKDDGIIAINPILVYKKDRKIIKIRIDQEKFLEIQNLKIV